MRSSAGIVAGLFLMALVANCGGDDSSNNPPTAGSSNSGGGEGGEGNASTGGNTNVSGSVNTAGNNNTGGAEGGAPATGCTKDADCGANSKCVDTVCKKDDGQTCTASAECVNACIDGKCTAKLDDGAECTDDDQCAHTCIDGKCAPASDVGGDCDVDLGAGGSGAGGAPAVLASGGAGGDAGLPPIRDCKAPLQCYAGKCLTPDGESCTDNTDCVNTCIGNVCTPKGSVDSKCDDTADCSSAQLVCDPVKKLCKLDTNEQCQINGQCQSNRCLCASADCKVRTCKTADSSCQCRYSPPDAPSCDNNSPVLNQQTTDPNGCSNGMFCNGGNCVANGGGVCNEPCTYHAATDNTAAYCTSAGAPTGCNGGWHGNVTTQCYIPKGTTTCDATCQCVLN